MFEVASGSGSVGVSSPTCAHELCRPVPRPRSALRQQHRFRMLMHRSASEHQGPMSLLSSLLSQQAPTAWQQQQQQQQQQGSWRRPAQAVDGVQYSTTGSSNGIGASSSNGRGASQRVVAYEGLLGDDFRHPLDQQNTSLLRGLPGLEFMAKTLLSPVAEQVLLLENIATSIQTGPEQLPTIHALLVEAAHVLQMECPELYVRQHPVANAYTLAISGRKPFIIVHTALLELLKPKELQAVIAHELGHLKCDHGLWLTVANVLASGTVQLVPFFSGTVEESLMRWLRAAELTCDRAALLVAQDPRVVISALMKLAGGTPAFANELNVDAFLEQARSYDEQTASMLGWYIRNAQTRALSHPLPVMRAREIDRWSQGPQYKALLTKNRNIRVGPYVSAPQNSLGSSGR